MTNNSPRATGVRSMPTGWKNIHRATEFMPTVLGRLYSTVPLLCIHFIEPLASAKNIILFVQSMSFLV